MPPSCGTVRAVKLMPLRLPPGADLRAAIEAAMSQRGSSASFVLSGIGSLTDTKLRLAGAQEITTIIGSAEIVSISGSVSPDGAHLHMAVADAQGVVLGGHVVYGNTVRTTAEVLLGLLPAWEFARELDPATGFKELVIRAVGTDDA